MPHGPDPAGKSNFSRGEYITDSKRRRSIWWRKVNRLDKIQPAESGPIQYQIASLLPDALPRFRELRDYKLPVRLAFERGRIKADQLASPPQSLLLFGTVAEPVLPNDRP